MMIKAKIVSDRSVATVDLRDDPSDKDLLDALGSRGDIVHRATVGDWDVLRGSDVGGRTLVIGNSPYLGEAPKTRKSCTLSDDQSQNLVKTIEDLLASMASK